MQRTRTTPVPAMRARFAGRAASALVAVALVAPPAADARQTDSAAPPGAAPRAAIAISQLMPGSLVDVAATSATNAWAVGDATSSSDGTTPSSPLILHWNGIAWTRQTAPVLPADQALVGVAARSPSDAWAVGGIRGPHRRALILHWNGAAWNRVATPAGSLSAVAILGPRNVWAVGSAAGRGEIFQLPLALHWNGRVWRRVRLPRLPAHFEGRFSAVSGSSPRNIWAVGSMTICGCGPGESLVMHWNGRSWKRQRPPAGACCFSLTGVAAISSRRAFAVGGLGEGTSATRAQAARFNGRRWRRQHTPSPGVPHFGEFGGDFLDGVAATSSGNAWAVGSTSAVGLSGITGVLVEHWNGRVWRRSPATLGLSPAVARFQGLSDVAAVARRDAWAVGGVVQTATNDSSAVILHWNGASWSPVPTAP